MNRETTPTPAPPAPPQRIAAVLRVVHVLLAYGRHLAGSAGHRAAAPGFAAIAACFGTANLSLILAHLHRGILRAVALERVLLARAARGRDIELAAPCIRTRPPAPANAAPGRNAAPPIPRPAAPACRLDQDHPANFQTPSLEQLEREVRRRPLGRTLVDICLDLAVVPGLCSGTFWNELFDLMRCHGGSIASLVQARWRREQAFDQEQDSRPTPGWTWPILGRQAIRQVLGFFIGEDPVIPLALSAPPPAVATGPP
ncbi:MAG: hypothetical protein JO157_08255 [Acetobacteraceae bacterium]|nr:hypothetical protein [Acetobacteraceae bacterium]